MTSRYNWLRLLPGFPLWVELLAGGAVVLFLLWSRFSLLASGPWEWDETLFARGLMRFQLAAHFPHPPGFPGWMAIGHAAKRLVGEPLRALQMASAALSVATVWPLAAVARLVAPAPLALAAAILVAVAPGPWLHAVRGFSSTPATFFLALAVLGASAPQARLKPTATTLLIAAAFLVRPQLLPTLVVLWLALALRVRALKKLLPGVLLSAGSGVLSLYFMAHAEGGWDKLWTAFATHGTRHFSRLANNNCTLQELGLVKSLGGPGGAAVLSFLVGVGLFAWWKKRGWREALVATLLLITLVGEILLLQNRTYTRYAVPAVLATGPLIAAGAAALAPPGAATMGLMALALWQGSLAYPLLVEQHRSPLPGWAAVETAAGLAFRHRLEVVVEPGLYPFASYKWYLLGGGAQPRHAKLRLSPWAPEPWQGVSGHYLVVTDRPERYLASLAKPSIAFGGVSRQLRPFTQQRFLKAAVLVNPPLPVGTWWPLETDPQGRQFMWASQDAAIALPPLPEGTWLRLDLVPAKGPAPLKIWIDGQEVAVLDGEAGRQRVWVPPKFLAKPGGHQVAFRRDAVYPPSLKDSRPLAVRLESVGVLGPKVPWGGPVALPEDRKRMRVALTGAWSPEPFPNLGWGVWLQPRAHLRLLAGEGRLNLTLAAMRPTPSRTVIRSEGHLLAGPVDVPNQPVELTVQIPPWLASRPTTEIEIVSAPFVPSKELGMPDDRELGVALFALSFEPAAPWPF